MSNETLLDKAKQNLLCAKTLYAHLPQDEVYLNYVGYHLQQAVELSLKYGLELNGISYSKTHDITQLIELYKENKIDIQYMDYIDEHSEMFTVWESKTRYVLNYKLEEKKIETALANIEMYLDNFVTFENNKIEENSEEEDEEL